MWQGTFAILSVAFSPCVRPWQSTTFAHGWTWTVPWLRKDGLRHDHTMSLPGLNPRTWGFCLAGRRMQRFLRRQWRKVRPQEVKTGNVLIVQNGPETCSAQRNGKTCFCWVGIPYMSAWQRFQMTLDRLRFSGLLNNFLALHDIS